MKKNNPKNKINQQIEGTDKVPSVVLRKCQACGKVTDRNDLIRIMTDYQTGEKIIMPNSKQFGKSVYICKSQECLKIAIKKKRLKNFSEEQIEKLKQLINNL